MTSMLAPTCETCGDTLPGPQAAGGHCPRCLFSITFSDDPALPEVEASTPWTQLSGCDLYEEIGRGGMGVVYRARQRGLDRVVAVKVLLRAQFATPEERSRFHREAQAAARLKHPGIVGIFDVGEDDDVPWFSMEYVAGQSLEQRVREHPLPAAEAARCVQQVALALQHAHDHGVLHRDLKPSNILLDKDSAPRITDFGIARVATSDTGSHTAAELTRTGQTLGSPGYSAPEQVLSGTADVRTDVYGLGALLYHLLTGRPPYQGPTLDAILVQLREADPLSPRRLNPSVPRDLETICLKCLNKLPAGRYPSATAVAEDLCRFMENKPIVARPLSLAGRGWRLARRYPAMAAMLVIIALLLAGIIGGSLAFARQQARMEHRSSLLSEARALRQTRLAGSRTQALEKLQQAWLLGPSNEIRHEAVACLALPEFGPVQRVTVTAPARSRSADNRFIAAFEGKDVVVRDAQSRIETARVKDQTPGSLLKLDDHGQRLAIAAPKNGLLKLINLADGRVEATCAHPLFLHDLDWSGDLIAAACDNRFIYIWDDQGRLKHRLSGHESPLIRVAFRPRSQELVSTAADSHVRLWHAARGVEIVRLETRHAQHASLWWSDTGRQLLAETQDGVAESFTIDPSSCLDVLAPPQDEPHSENLGSAGFCSNGRLAAVVDEEAARVWDFGTGRLIHRLPKQSGQWLSALFSPDTTKLWTCGWAHELTEQSVTQNAEGSFTLGPPRILMPGQGNLLRDVSSDGTRLVLSNNSVGQFLVVPATGGGMLRIKHPGTLATAISPDGKWLVTTSYQSPGARIWSIPGGKLLRTLCENDTVMQVSATRDHRLILKTTGPNRVFRTTDWTEERALPDKLRLNSMVLSHDGQHLAATGENDVRLYETRGFTETLRLTVPEYCGWLGECHLAFDGDSTHLLIHTALGSVVRWNLATVRAELRKLGMEP